MDESKFNVLVNLDLIGSDDNEALAAVSLSPHVAWAKFILTDDKPNSNKHRVPIEEFDNLIRTGTFMPMKMAEGGIKDGHDESLPIGVITHLKKVNNQIQGLAALWERERPDDIEMIRARYKNKEPLQLSWEILYNESTATDDGVQELRGTTLRAVTLVGVPAYEGRTPIIAVASDMQVTKEKVEDNSTNMELEELKNTLADKEKELATVKEELSTKVLELEKENTELKEFKATIEKEKANIEKLVGIKAKFSEAGIEKDEQYFVDNAEKLLSMSEEAFSFMLQELVSFSAVKKDATASKGVLPPVNTSGTGSLTVKDMASYLRTNKK